MEFTAHDLIAPRLHRPLGPGDVAPPFALRDQWGQLVSLSDFAGVRPVILFFYPKDYAPSCALESIAYRETYAGLAALGAEVIGISQSPPEASLAASMLLALPFKLLTDTRHCVRDRFGAPGMQGGRESRITYVIGKDGFIRLVFRGETAVREQVRAELLAENEAERVASL